jgi:hypothetical protein
MNIPDSLTPRSLYSVLLACTLLMLFGVSCASSDAIPLASFTENSVDVSIWLEPGADGSCQLFARFTPPAGFHLYSKDIPLTGVDGLGRPTLLELPAGAKMQASGPLTESIPAEIPAFEPKELLVYPAGPVTLTLLVKLPENQTGIIQDVLSITYMACSETGCKPPVVGKIISINVSAQK